MEKVMRRKGEYVIPHEAIPEIMTRISVSPEDKVVCLERTEAMFTTYWASAGEISPFFLAVMKEKKIIGARCPKCKMVICPPYMTRCPVCQKEDKSLVDLEFGVEMPQVGYMLGTPPITVFANARFARYAPFGRGRVILGDSQSALPIQVFTTTGFLKPGIFKRGTQVKIVFRKNRMGFSTDYFAVPLEEVPEKLRSKKGLEETELKWQSQKLAAPKVTAETQKGFPKILEAVRKFVGGNSQEPPGAEGSDELGPQDSGQDRRREVRDGSGQTEDQNGQGYGAEKAGSDAGRGGSRLPRQMDKRGFFGEHDPHGLCRHQQPAGYGNDL